MEFLTPAPAIIAGAIALPVLIVFYLLKLRRRPVRVSTTMFWEATTRDVQVNTPFRLIRPSLMLLLQLLILAALLAALARPAIRAGDATASRTIILIDRSASMQARDMPNGASRFDAAIERAATLIERTGSSNASVAVIAFAARADVVSSFTTERRSLVRSVRSLEGTDQPGNLAAALELAEAMALRDAGDESADVEPVSVVIISDGGFSPDASLSIAGARVGYERVGPETLNNLGITAISARRDFEDPGLVRLFARVTNAGPTEVRTSAAVSLDGEAITRTPVAAPAGSDVVVRLDLDIAGSGLIGLHLEHEDALTADDQAFVTLAPARTPRIVHVTPGDENEADWVLSDLLAELAGPSYVPIDIAAYRAQVRAGAPIEASLIVFDRVAPESPAPTATLSFGGSPFIEGVTLRNEAPESTRVLGWRRSHPIMRDVSMDSVYVAEAMAADIEGNAATSLAEGRRGPLIVYAEGRNRHVWVGFEPAQSNWPTEPGFIVFVANAVDHLTLLSASGQARSYSTSESIRMMAPDAGAIALEGPTRVEAARNGDELFVGVLPRAGVYQSGDGSVVLAVNMVDARESLIESPDALEIGGAAIQAGEDVIGAPREVWHWFVIAAAVVLAVEWFWVAQLNRV